MNKAERAAELGALPDPLSDAQLGELNTLLNRHLNTASDAFVHKLYDEPPHGWGYPPQYIKEGGRNTTRLARDTDSLLALTRHYPEDLPLLLALQLSDKLTQLKPLNCEIDKDSRIRYSANLGGTETQRHACHKSSLDTGYNLHTTTEGHKHLFIADEDCELWNVDLSGADGWTIACECAALGDPTMLEDLRAGLKPAQAVCLIYEHGVGINSWDRQVLVAKAKEIDKNSWLYTACKKSVWGFCYGMGEQKQISVIADESYAETGIPVFIPLPAIRNLRTCIATRYPGIAKRWRQIEMKLDRDGFLDCANGSRRVFFGHPRDRQTQAQAYAHHPQVMTTYVTSLAWQKMWCDPDNVDGRGERIAQPLLLVHDSILFQAPIRLRDWVKDKVRQWFANPVTIAGITLTVPFSGGCGPTWAHAGAHAGFKPDLKI